MGSLRSTVNIPLGGARPKRRNFAYEPARLLCALAIVCELAYTRLVVSIYIREMEVVTTNSRAKRTASKDSYVPGFYRSLNARSSADSTAPLDSDPASQCLRLPHNSELPSNCFIVERVIFSRKFKV